MKEQLKRLLDDSMFENTDVLRAKIKNLSADLELFHNDSGNCLVLQDGKIIARISTEHITI